MSKFKRREFLGVCNYCGDNAFYRFKNGNLCCQKIISKCPAQRKKVSKNNAMHRLKITIKTSGKNHWNFNKKYAEKRAKGAPLCACECGEKTKWNPDTQQYNKYITGHNTRIKNPMNNPESVIKISIANRGKKNLGASRANSLRTGKNNYWFGKIGKDHSKHGIKCPEQSKYMKNGGAAHANFFVKNPSKPQIKLFEFIKLFYPEAILNYSSLNKSIDIAIPDQMIAIEYDGSYWHQDQEADEKRQKELEAIGWRFLRYCDYVPSIEELKNDLKQHSRP